MSPLHLSRRGAHVYGVLLAAIRTAFGAVALWSPERMALPWAGPTDTAHNRLLGRALGARDLALGLGGLAAAGDSRQLRSWVIAGGLADAGDLAATVTNFKHIPKPGAVGVGLLTAGAVVAAALVAKGLSSPR